MSEIAPATLEGWFALHQMVEIDRAVLRGMSDGERATLREDTASLMSRLAAP